MPTLWFMIVAVMVAMYVLLDGFDIGAGAVHLFIAKDDTERRTILRAIGPVWDGNEVWLLAAVARSSLRSRYFTRRASAASTFR
jgi:cytochrome d ubiquinol oxidase subunit II